MAQERRNATSNLERLPAFIARHLLDLFEPRYRRSEARPPSVFGERGVLKLIYPALTHSAEPRPATARMTGALVDRSQLGRTHETVAYLARN
jgi:hypothetical protein